MMAPPMMVHSTLTGRSKSDDSRNTLRPGWHSRTMSRSHSRTQSISDSSDNETDSSESDFGDWGYASWDEEHYVPSSRKRNLTVKVTRQTSKDSKDSKASRSSKTSKASKESNEGKEGKERQSQEDDIIIFRAPVITPPSPPPPPPLMKRLTRKPTSKRQLRIQHVDHNKTLPKRPASPGDGASSFTTSSSSSSSSLASTASLSRCSTFGSVVTKEHDYNSFKTSSPPPVPSLITPTPYINVGYKEWEDSYMEEALTPAIAAAALCARYGHQLESDAPGRNNIKSWLGRRKCRRCERSVKV